MFAKRKVRASDLLISLSDSYSSTSDMLRGKTEDVRVIQSEYLENLDSLKLNAKTHKSSCTYSNMFSKLMLRNELEREIQVSNSPISALVYNNGDIYVGTSKGRLKIFKNDEKEIWIHDDIMIDRFGIRDLVMIEDRRFIISVSKFNVKIWKVNYEKHAFFKEGLVVEGMGNFQRVFYDEKLAFLMVHGYLLTNDEHKSKRIYSVATFQLDNESNFRYVKRQNFEKSHRLVTSAVYMYAGDELALAGEADLVGFFITVWQRRSTKGSHLFKYGLNGHKSTVTVLSAKADILVSGSIDKTVIVWKRSEEDNRMTIFQKIDIDKRVLSLALSEPGSFLMIGDHETTVYSYKINKKKTKFKFKFKYEKHLNGVTRIVHSEVDKLFLTGSGLGKVKVVKENFQRQYQEERAVINIKHKDFDYGMMISPDQNYLVTWDFFDYRIWKLRLKNEVKATLIFKVDNCILAYKCACFSANEKLIAVSLSNKGRVEVYTTARIGLTSFQKPYRIDVSSKTVTVMRFFEVLTETIIIGFLNNDPVIYCYSDGDKAFTKSETLDCLLEETTEILVTNEDSKILVGSRNGNIRLFSFDYDMKKYKILQILECDSYPTKILSLNNARFIVAALNKTGWMTFKYFKCEKKYSVLQVIEDRSKNNVIFAKVKKSTKNEMYLISHDYYNYDDEVSLNFWMIRNETLIKLDGAKIQKARAFGITGDLQKVLFSIKEDGEDYGLEVANFKEEVGIDENFDTYKLFRLIFEVKDNFIDSENFNFMIEYFKDKFNEKNGSKCQFRNWLNMNLKVHSKLNLLMYAVFSNNPKIVSKILKNFGYKQQFYHKNYDPIEIALDLDSQQNVDFRLTLDSIADYFEEHPNKFSCFFTLERFYTIMKSSSNKLRDLALREFFQSKEQGIDRAIPKSFPINKKEGYIVIEHDIKFRDLKFVEKLNDLIANSKFDFSKVNYYSIPFPVNLNLGYKFTTKFLEMMSETQDEYLQQKVRFVVREIYVRSKPILWIYALINWLNIILFSLESVWAIDTPMVRIPSIATSIMLFLFEWMVIAKNPSRYFQTTYKVIDFYTYHAVPLLQIIDWIHDIDDTDLLMNGWINITLMVMGFRSLTMFQIFDSVRYFVQCIILIMRDTSSFVIFFLGSIFSFSVVNVEALKTDGEFKGTFAEYTESLNLVYNSAYGNWGDTNEINTVKYINFLVSSIFLNLMMLNILIVTIEEIFLAFREQKILSDVKLMTSILNDFNEFISYFVEQGGKKDKRLEVYVHMIELEQGGEEDISEKVEQTGEKIIEKIDEFNSKIDDRFAAMEQSIDKKLSHVSRENEALRNQNNELGLKLQKLLEKMGD